MGAGLTQALTPQRIAAVFAELRERLGPQDGWWPQADGAIEVCAGAILVQHTSWRGAALGIEALRRAGALRWEAWLEPRGGLGRSPHPNLAPQTGEGVGPALRTTGLTEEQLADVVRPAGTYRAKARTLRALAEAIEACGGLDGVFAGDADEVRVRLLCVRGIGDETADAIALYAAHKPTFVVDAYARRLFERAGAPLPPRIHDARALVVQAARRDVATLQEWHALAVEAGRRARLTVSASGRERPQCCQPRSRRD